MIDMKVSVLANVFCGAMWSDAILLKRSSAAVPKKYSTFDSRLPNKSCQYHVNGPLMYWGNKKCTPCQNAQTINIAPMAADTKNRDSSTTLLFHVMGPLNGINSA
jgi:hypothetical protein